jgi:hypothetical protein
MKELQRMDVMLHRTLEELGKYMGYQEAGFEHSDDGPAKKKASHGGYFRWVAFVTLSWLTDSAMHAQA